jgi:hypothetical protein
LRADDGDNESSVLRRRRPQQAAGPSWQQRTITLIGSRDETLRICDAWAAESWRVMTVDEGPQTPGGHPTHVVRVAVPPVGWRSDEELLDELGS